MLIVLIFLTSILLTSDHPEAGGAGWRSVGFGGGISSSAGSSGVAEHLNRITMGTLFGWCASSATRCWRSTVVGSSMIDIASPSRGSQFHLLSEPRQFPSVFFLFCSSILGAASAQLQEAAAVTPALCVCRLMGEAKSCRPFVQINASWGEDARDRQVEVMPLAKAAPRAEAWLPPGRQPHPGQACMTGMGDGDARAGGQHANRQDAGLAGVDPTREE